MSKIVEVIGAIGIFIISANLFTVAADTISGNIAPAKSATVANIHGAGLLAMIMQAGNSPAACRSADSIIRVQRKRFPADQELLWMSGLCRIRQSDILGGIRLIDSVRSTGFAPDSLMRCYADFILQAFVPLNALKDAGLGVLENAPGLADTLMPSSAMWKISDNLAPGSRTLPSFTFGAGYDMRKPFTLVFGGLIPEQAPCSVLVRARALHGLLADSDFGRQLLSRTEPAYSRIMIDCNQTRQSYIEYIALRINNAYDSIQDIATSVAKSPAILLRCYSFPRYSHEGYFVAIVVFDRTIAQIAPVSARKFPQSSRRTIRYTIMVRTALGARELAESKLQSILRQF
jgi:hypothetical protein